jgi:methionyl-tRNA formyltransferase
VWHHWLVGRVGFEPTRGYPQGILSPLRLPFRHRPWTQLNSSRLSWKSQTPGVFDFYLLSYYHGTSGRTLIAERRYKPGKAVHIVVLVYESLYANYMLSQLLEARPGEVVGIVRSDCLIHGKTLPQALWFLVRWAGLRFVGRKALELFQYRAAALIYRLIGRCRRVRSLREMAAAHQVPILGSVDVNDVKTMAAIRSWRPDLVISIYLNQRITPPLIALPRLGCINIHPALLPRNRGLFPYFWVLANGDEETGVTVHWVDEKFDTGGIILQERLKVEPDDTIQSLAYKSCVIGARMLIEAVRLIEEGTAPNIPQDSSKASYFSWPRRADLRRFRERKCSFGTLSALLRYM